MSGVFVNFSPFYFFRHGLSLSLNPKLIIWLGWLANELQGPTCLYLFNTGIIDACTHTQLLGGGRVRIQVLTLVQQTLHLLKTFPVPALPTH